MNNIGEMAQSFCSNSGMDKMRYSRGGGGSGGSTYYGGGRARGFMGKSGRPHGGRGSKAWVRPRESVKSADASIPIGDHQSASNKTSLSLQAVASGPILKGPSGNSFSGGRVNRGRGRGGSTGRTNYQTSFPKHSWRRDATHETLIGEAKNPPKFGQASGAVQLQAFNEDKYTLEQEQRGNPENPSGSARELTRLRSNEIVPPDSRTASIEAQGSSGHFQPVDREHSNEQESMAASTNDGQATNGAVVLAAAAAGERKMIQKGANKLVLSNRNDQTVQSKSRSSGPSNRQLTSWNNPSSRSSKRPRSPVNDATVKRVKLATSHSETGKDDETEAKQSSDELKGKSANLTAFAYRETSNRLQRGRFGSINRGGGGRGRGQNMGLVRVNPDDSKTPICRTFLRGIRCENERCTARHDVPRESAMPICSFFQRHGQCLKGSECPFRHVKVNALATICPSFSQLGYCNNEKCAMKHVAANKRL
jgi:Zinc finger C-x8-C-x5-C-x3-H type (and similar)